jgi:hypothetical protein
MILDFEEICQILKKFLKFKRNLSNFSEICKFNEKFCQILEEFV